MKMLPLGGETPSRLPMSRLISDAGTADHDAFAQITARCSQQVEHAYAVYLWVDSDRVGDARYTHGSMKFNGGYGADAVEQAVAYFCSFMVGRALGDVESISPELLIQERTRLATEDAKRSAQSVPGQDADCKGEQGEGSELFRILQTAGALPFVLFNWARANYQLKRVIAEITGTRRGDVVRLRKSADVARLLTQLEHVPIFAQQRRGLEIGIRSLDMNTVDESSLRSAYQRASLETLHALAQHRGFADEFSSNL